MGDKTPDSSVRTYADVMRDQQLAKERDNTMQNIADKLRKEEEERELDARPTKASGVQLPPPPPAQPAAAAKSAAGEKRRNRWDQSNGVDACVPLSAIPDCSRQTCFCFCASPACSGCRSCETA